MGDVYYRIVRNAVPAVDDFRSAREEGIVLIDERLRNEWEFGISVYDNLDYAMKRARTSKSDLGQFAVALRIPADAGVEVRQTGRNQRHYTVYATGNRALILVEGDTISVSEEATSHE